MPLILAIEPDKRQASQLTAIVRGRLRAELVLADCADRALAALGDRVPDLILTAALLSPKDESALDERLRSLNGAAAHVQTLTIPVLATGSRHARGGILSALRRDKPNPAHAPEGCDPAVFAEQCKEYLERAVRERQEMSAQLADGPTPAAAPIETAPIAAMEQDFDLAVGDDRNIVERADERGEEPVAEPIFECAVEPPVEASPDVDVVHVPRVGSILDLTPSPQRLPQPRPRPAQEVAPPPPPAAIEPERPARKPRRRKKTFDLEGPDGPATLVAALALLEAEGNKPVEQVAPEPAAACATEKEFEIEAYAPEQTFSETQLYTQLSRRTAWSWPVMTVMTAEGLRKDAIRRPGPSNVPGNAAEPVQEWVDIIEALRRDAEQIPMRRAAAAPAAPVPVSDAGAQAAKRKKKRNAAAPAQDEWGFFDPDRCGFAALLEKLEEITEQDDTRTQPSRA